MYYISRHGSHTVHCSYSVTVTDIVEQIGGVFIFTPTFTEFWNLQRFDVRGKICGVKMQKMGITKKIKKI